MIDVTRDGRMMTVTLNQPPDNRLNGQMFVELNEALDRVPASEIDLLLFSGRGSFFSKGFDLEQIRACRDPEEMRRDLSLINQVYRRILRMPVVRVAAINGHCFGGGLELALLCHFRVCAERIRIGLPEMSAGIIPGLGGVHRLAAVVGAAKALELIAMGDMVTPEEALRLNLVSRVFPKADFATHVSGFVRTLLMANADTIRDVIRLVAESPGRDDDANTEAAIEAFVRAFGRGLGAGGTA